MKLIENARTLPQVYFGLHMVEGVAEYIEKDASSFRIFIGEDTIKNMDPTFKGRPVYVQHVAKVDLANIQAEADGYVIRSFFNKADGKHWAEFIVVSDRGHEAIRSGWKLSNAYVPKELANGGQWHGVDYSKEVVRGEYEHLAIVPSPRYEESVILTPDEFKLYNSKKESELLRLANSKEKKSMFKFWKKTAIENSADFENTMVQLPESKKEFSLADLIKNADSSMMPHHMCNMAHRVKVGEEEMSVEELVNAHIALKQSMIKPEVKENEIPVGDHEKAKEKAEDLVDHERESIAEEKKENSKEPAAPVVETPSAEKIENDKKLAEKELADKALAELPGSAHFEALKDAPLEAIKNSAATAAAELSEDKVARGKSRYGSN